MKPMWAAIPLACLVIGGLGVGASEAMAYTMGGPGISSCESWTTAPRDGKGDHLLALENQSWVLGFLSGVGYAGANRDPLQGLNSQAVAAWVDDYCTAHPIDTIATAAGAFVIEHPR